MKFLKFAVAIPLAVVVYGQAPGPPPEFEVAEIQPSSRPGGFLVMQYPRPQNGRVAWRSATMVDLIAAAWGMDADKVVGGPSWLEMDRYDVVAKVSDTITPETQKLMLQALLLKRFRLVVHKDAQPVDAYALRSGKKPLMIRGDGAGPAGCTIQNAPVFGKGQSQTAGTDYTCGNMTMEAFAAGLRDLRGASRAIGTMPVRDETGLKGAWNFEVQLPPLAFGDSPEQSYRRLFEVLETQLGLKLEPVRATAPVLVVESVNEKPTPNPPNIAELLPPIALPARFEVADVKPADPNGGGATWSVRPGGRVSMERVPLYVLVRDAFSGSTNQLVGMPDDVGTLRFTIAAETPALPPGVTLTIENYSPLLRNLLVDRFGLRYHSEDRIFPTYTLVAVKPKMKKADPAARSKCKTQFTGRVVGGTVTLSCQNLSMDQLADRLLNTTTELRWPISNTTAIEGGWDFVLTYTNARGTEAVATAPGGDLLSAAQPSGVPGIFEAVEKQLGLRLEPRKSPVPVIVIDHLDLKPTAN